MRSRNNIFRMVVLTLALVATALPALAGGPLLIFDAGSQTPYAYGGPVPMITDLGALGAVPNASADALVAGSAAQWAGVPSSSFNAAVTGDFAGVGLPDITGANAGLVIGTDNPGNGIFVIYDTDGTVTQNFLGAPPGVLGVASPEFAAGAVLTESWVVLNGSTINPGDLPGATSWQGVITHEMGHSINMAHTQTNGAVIFFGDDTGASGCLPPYGGGPGFNAMATMFPFIDPSPGSTGVQQATIEHPDDTTTLSDLYPAGGYPGGFATIEGTVFNTNGVSPVTGVNVIARNIANPYLDAVSALSGDFTQGGLGPDGRYRLTGLTPGANYVLYVDEIVQGGFSTPPLQPLGAPEEYWNAGESNNDIADPPCDFTAINVAANQTVTADFQLNGAAPAPAIGVSPSGFTFSIPTNTMASDIMNISNIAGPGATALNWTIVDATSAFDLPVNAKALDPARISIDRSGLDPRDPAAMRQCRDCAGEHASRVTPLDFDSAAMAPGVITDGSFELGPGGGAWLETSTNFGTPICDAGLCGTGGGTGPRTGTYWTWFGGIAAFEAGSVRQSVILPSGGPLSLEFYLELNACDSPADFMEVLIDGTQVFLINGGDVTCGSIGYTMYSVDISAFADDASHVIQFRSEIFATGGGGSNFFLDDVSLVQATTDCPWLSASPTAGSTPQGGSSPVSVMVDATGLAPGLYLCELRIASNDPGNPLIAVPVDLEVLPAGPTEINAIVFPINSLNGSISLFSLPDGTGEPLAAAQLWNGVPGDSPIIVDATIGVRLVDQVGNPVAGIPPQLIRVQSQFGGWKECTTSFLIADGPTDAAGLTTISGRLFAGGFSGPGELMQVVVDDPLFQAATYPGGLAGLEYFVNSADITGDLQANLSDVAAFAGPYINGPFAYAIDFRRDGVANLSDVSRLGIGVGALCPAPPVAALAESPSLRVTETIGVAFDLAGTIQARMLEPGTQIDAYVFLQGPATEQGIEAFDTRVRVSDNVVIHEREVVGRGLNVADQDDFTVGLAEARRADASRVAPLVRLRVSVKDDSPAYFWVEPTSRSGEAVPTVSSEGRIQGARPVSGDVDLAVASLNDKDFALDGGATPRARLAMGIAPNPFNPMTQIRFELPASGPVDLRVFDARGQLVSVLRTEDMAAGRHEVVWNGTDRTGRVVATGVYFARLQTREGTLLEKMMLMK